MKKSFIYIFSAFCFSCGINSCSFLDENPADRLVVDNFYTSEKDAQAAVDATYQQLNSLYNRLMYMMGTLLISQRVSKRWSKCGSVYCDRSDHNGAAGGEHSGCIYRPAGG